MNMYMKLHGDKHHAEFKKESYLNNTWENSNINIYEEAGNMSILSLE